MESAVDEPISEELKDHKTIDETKAEETGDQTAVDEAEPQEVNDQRAADEINPEETGGQEVANEAKPEDTNEEHTAADDTDHEERKDENADDSTLQFASIPSDAVWRRKVEGTVNGNSEITFPDGTTYNGEWLARQESETQRTIIRHGKGFHMFTDASWYEGEWDFDRQHGEGEAEFPDGTLFKGSWENGLMRAGSLSTPDGHVYTGKFEDNKMHGSGDMLYSNGAIYRGSWMNGKKHGSGHYTYSNGNTYNGNWVQDFCNGQGTYTSCKGWSYEGEFELGKRHGNGRIRYKGGDEYLGQFSHGSRHGKGKFTNANGGFYDGEWVHDRKHGNGTFCWKELPQGDAEGGMYTYTGTFNRGLRSGRGKLEYPTGETYEGEWLNNLRHGHGIVHAHAFTYDGGFHLDKRHGSGTLFCQGQFTYVGEFENGRQHGEAKLVTARGTSFLGCFFEGRPHGPAIVEQELRPGLWVVCRCEYANGRRVGLARVEGDKKTFTLQYDEHGTLLSMKVRPQKKEEENEMMRTYGRALTNHRKEFRSVQEGIYSARSGNSGLPPPGDKYFGDARAAAVAEDRLNAVSEVKLAEPASAPHANRAEMVEERESLELQQSSTHDTPDSSLPSLPPTAPSHPPAHVESVHPQLLPTSEDKADTKEEESSEDGPSQAKTAGLKTDESVLTEKEKELKEDEIMAWLGAEAGADPVSSIASAMAEDPTTVPHGEVHVADKKTE